MSDIPNEAPEWLKVLVDAPGPSPWYLTRSQMQFWLRWSRPVEVAGVAGPFSWAEAGDREPLISKSVLVSESGVPVLVLGPMCWVLPLAPPYFVVWYQKRGAKGIASEREGSLIVSLFDSNALGPIPDISHACEHMRLEDAHLWFTGGEVARVEISLDGTAVRRVIPFPEPFTVVNELLLWANSNVAGTKNHWDKMNTCLVVLKPKESAVEILPQDWYNNGHYDFMYTSLTRVAHDPKTGKVIGEGFRMHHFVLDATLRQV